MATDKRRAEHDRLLGFTVLRPEWEAQRDDARTREIEKTRTLREARLAAQATTAKPARAAAPVAAAPKAAQAKRGAAVPARRGRVAAASE